MIMQVLWAHGLEGSPDGSKPTWIIEKLGWEVIAPIMSTNGWTIKDQTQVVIDTINSNPNIRIIMGSSYGGLAIANASEMLKDRDLCLVLMAPAFGLADNFRNVVGDAGISEWEEKNSREYFHHGLQEEISLKWNFMEAAESMSWPILRHPTVIIHGTMDDIVPISNSHDVVNGNDSVELIEVEDGHRLTESLHYIPLAVERVLSKKESMRS